MEARVWKSAVSPRFDWPLVRLVPPLKWSNKIRLTYIILQAEKISFLPINDQIGKDVLQVWWLLTLDDADLFRITAPCIF